MDAKNLTELDVDYIHLCAVYQTSRSKFAPYYDLAKIAEMGSIYAQQKWCEISKSNDELPAIKTFFQGYNQNDYETQFLFAMYHLRKDRDVINKTLFQMKHAKSDSECDALKFNIIDLPFYTHLMNAINLCEEKLKSGRGDLLDRERLLEMYTFNPLHTQEDVKDYRRVRSALAIEHWKDKSNPAYAFALAQNYRLFNPNEKNNKKSKDLFDRLTHLKPSKSFIGFRGPNIVSCAITSVKL